MAPRATHSEMLRAKALRDKGLTLAQISRELGRSQHCLARWERNGYKPGINVMPETAVAPDEPPALVAPPEPPATTHEPPAAQWGAGMSELERTESMQADLYRMADEAKRMGNYTAAQRAMRDAAQLAPVIARLRKAMGGDGDGVVITSAQIAAAEKSLQDKLAILAGQPILCAHCGRALRIAQAEADVQEGEA